MLLVLVAAAAVVVAASLSELRSLHSNLTSTGGGQYVSEDRQHLLFLHRLTSLPHQLLLSWFVPYLSSLVELVSILMR